MTDRSQTLRPFAERIVTRSASPDTGNKTIDDRMAAARAKYVNNPHLVARVLNESKLTPPEAEDATTTDRIDRLGNLSEELVGEGSRQSARSKILHLPIEIVKEPWLLGEDYEDQVVGERIRNIQINSAVEKNDKLFASLMEDLDIVGLELELEQAGQPISNCDFSDWDSLPEYGPLTIAARAKQEQEPESSGRPRKPARE